MAIATAPTRVRPRTDYVYVSTDISGNAGHVHPATRTFRSAVKAASWGMIRPRVTKVDKDLWFVRASDGSDILSIIERKPLHN